MEKVLGDDRLYRPFSCSRSVKTKLEEDYLSQLTITIGEDIRDARDSSICQEQWE